MHIPNPELLDEYFPALFRMVSNTIWLPNRDTVKALSGAACRRSRERKLHPRLSPIMKGDEAIGMYDDNTTPRWAMLWAHDIPMTGHPSGWAFAHVWEDADNINSYTHLANLVMVPEAFASLTDKNWPLTSFLRWHAWHVYGWRPEGTTEPTKPDGYNIIEWRNLRHVNEPKVLIGKRIKCLHNQRVEILRPIMKRLGML